MMLWQLRRYAAVGIGGAVGACARWVIADEFGPQSGFDWPIFIVNIVGCFLLGLLLGEETRVHRFHNWLHDFGAIGFCGGLTTMSTFSLDVVKLLDRGCSGIAIAYLFANVVVGLACLVLGALISRHIDALTMELEEEP